MSFLFKSNYNFEILSFLNVLTSDAFYLEHHRDTYNKFFPLLSQTSKDNISVMVQKMHQTNLAFMFNIILAAMRDYEDKDICTAFQMDQELEYIIEELKKHAYIPADVLNEANILFTMAAAIMNDLESLGFREYWRREMEPFLKIRCRELQEFVNRYDFEDMFKTLKPALPDNVNVYICTFHRPHSTKINLVGDVILSDFYSNETTLMILIHELFHPPYVIGEVSESLRELSEKPWVIEAFENQNENCRYSQMDYFLEENIVEALGIYIAYKLGIEKEPYKYFENHDYGSHVVSPFFFKYLLENPKHPLQSFSEYLSDFVGYIR